MRRMLVRFGLSGLLGTTLALGSAFPWMGGALETRSEVSPGLVFTAPDHHDLSAFTPTSLSLDLKAITPGLGATPAVLTLLPRGSAQQLRQGTAPLTWTLKPARAGVYSILHPSLDVRLDAPLSLNPAVPAAGPDVPRQRYLHVGDTGDYRHAGKAVDAAFLQSHVLTLVKLEPQRAVFSAEGLGEVVRAGNTAQGFPDLAAVVEDLELQQLRRQYVGRPIWAYGGLKGTCRPNPGTSIGFDAPMKSRLSIRNILRLAAPMRLNVNGGAGDDVGRGADVTALTPLMFLIAASPEIHVGGTFSSSVITPPGAVPPTAEEMMAAFFAALDSPQTCGETYVLPLPDTWAVPRVFSLTPPGADVPSEAPEDAKGLTRLQYAWLSGFPSASYGTVQELMAASTWSYRNIPFPATVTFGQNGRVQQVDVPRLP